MRNLSNSERVEVLYLYREGVTPGEIAEQLGYDWLAVRRACDGRLCPDCGCWCLGNRCQDCEFDRQRRAKDPSRAERIRRAAEIREGWSREMYFQRLIRRTPELADEIERRDAEDD